MEIVMLLFFALTDMLQTLKFVIFVQCLKNQEFV